MRLLVQGAMASVALASLFVVQGCGRDGTEQAAQPAQPPPAPTSQPAPATPPGDSMQPQTGSTTAPAEQPDAATTAAADAGEGQQVFQTYCQTCHGPKGEGDGPAAAGLNPKPASLAQGMYKYDPNGNGKKGEIEDIKAIVRDGAAKYGGSPLMAPWPSLSPQQLQAVAEYVKSLQKS